MLSQLIKNTIQYKYYINYIISGFSNFFFTDAVAVTWIDRIIPSMQWAISIGVSSSIVSSLNCTLFSASRIYFVASQEGQLPLILSTLNIHSCPVVAVIHILIFASILIIPSDLITLINYVGFTDWILLGLMMTGLIKLRFQEPNLSRPYKVNPTLKKIPFIFLKSILYFEYFFL